MLPNTVRLPLRLGTVHVLVPGVRPHVTLRPAETLEYYLAHEAAAHPVSFLHSASFRYQPGAQAVGRECPPARRSASPKRHPPAKGTAPTEGPADAGRAGDGRHVA